MPWSDQTSTDALRLRLGSAVAEIDGLYSELAATAEPGLQRRLRNQLAQAAQRLADLAGTAAGTRTGPTASVPGRRNQLSRLRRRQAAVVRGAEWVINRYREDPPRSAPDREAR